MRMEVFTGPERRRRWPDDEKLSILSEVGVHGATVADVARRHDITRQHIYQWGQEMRSKGRFETHSAVFLPVKVDPPAADARARDHHDTSTMADGIAEIVLTNGRRLRVAVDFATAMLSQLIQTVETA